MKTLKLALITAIPSLMLGAVLPQYAEASRWNSANDPEQFDVSTNGGYTYNYNFNSLPLKGSLDADNLPWSETYWPRNKGSINIRWNAPGTPGFDYHSPTRAEVLKMTREQLAQLSPAEKYDLAMGDYNYSITKEVAHGRALRSAQDWEGICDGWTAMAIQLKEPKPVDVTNPDGVSIPFGSSDVKGLISYYGIEYAELNKVYVGSFCGKLGAIFGTAACDDINPGAYHVVLANEIGIKKQAFAAEIDPKREVWNQPAFGYEFEVVGSARSSAPKALRIRAKLYYTDELDQSQWLPVTGTNQFKSSYQESEYILEMDTNDQIIGGSWIRRSNHPDVFWKPTKQVEFTGRMVGLNKIYQPI